MVKNFFSTLCCRLFLVLCGWIAFFVSFLSDCSGWMLVTLQAIARVLPSGLL